MYTNSSFYGRYLVVCDNLNVFIKTNNKRSNIPKGGKKTGENHSLSGVNKKDFDILKLDERGYKKSGRFFCRRTKSVRARDKCYAKTQERDIMKFQQEIRTFSTHFFPLNFQSAWPIRLFFSLTKCQQIKRKSFFHVLPFGAVETKNAFELFSIKCFWMDDFSNENMLEMRVWV